MGSIIDNMINSFKNKSKISVNQVNESILLKLKIEDLRGIINIRMGQESNQMSQDVIKLSMELDDLIVEWLKIVEKQYKK